MTDSTAIVRNTEQQTAFQRMLEDARPRMLAVVPHDMSVERLIGVANNIVARDERVRECTPASVVRAVVMCAELGLDPSPKLGQAWFIPRGVKDKRTGKYVKICELQMGYKGALKKAYECERILSVDAVIVHAADRFTLTRGTHPDVLHEVKFGDRGPAVGAYFAARLAPADGNVWRVDEMSYADILGIRDRSDGWKAFKAGRIKTTPWSTDEEEMARKTILIRGLKTCPISDSFRRALEADADDMRAARAASVEQAPSRTDDLKAKLGVTPAAADVVEAEYEDVDPEDDGR
jgi:recombination protein RecT